MKISKRKSMLFGMFIVMAGMFLGSIISAKAYDIPPVEKCYQLTIDKITICDKDKLEKWIRNEIIKTETEILREKSNLAIVENKMKQTDKRIENIRNYIKTNDDKITQYEKLRMDAARKGDKKEVERLTKLIDTLKKENQKYTAEIRNLLQTKAFLVQKQKESLEKIDELKNKLEYLRAMLRMIQPPPIQAD